MSDTVNPRWFRVASWPALRLLAIRREAELRAAAAQHYARYACSGDSRRLLFDVGDVLEVTSSNAVLTAMHPTNITRPALSSAALLRAEELHARHVEAAITADELLDLPVSSAARIRQLRANERRRVRRAEQVAS